MAEGKPRWLSIGKAASYLGVSRDTLRRWEKKGRIKPVRSPTNRRYYTKKQLDELMSGEKEEKVRQRSKGVSKTQKLILAGGLSFVIAAFLTWLLLNIS